MAVRVRVLGDGDVHADLVSLRNWLVQEDELRGRVEMDDPEVAPGQMGALPEVLAVAVGSGGALTVLAQQTRVWLQQRRSNVQVQIRDDESGKTVSVSADHLDDPAGLVRDVLGQVGPER